MLSYNYIVLLAIDVGNTNIHLGVFEENNLLCNVRLSTDLHRLQDEYTILLMSALSIKGIDPKAVHGISICSGVPPVTTVINQVCIEQFKTTPLIVGTGVKTGVRILTENPRFVGTDRIVDAVAAYRIYGGPTIVVDFGTATSFDAISSKGDFLGGAIAPGITVAAEALHQSAAQLRRVEISPPPSAIGKNTISSMQSGLYFGSISMVEGMVARFKQEMGMKTNVIATGGLAESMAKGTQIFNAVNQDLTLHGLRMVYELNQEPKATP